MFPTLYDDALKLSIATLKKLGYLGESRQANGTVIWNRNGRSIGEIGVYCDTVRKTPYIELNYKYKDEPRKYKVQLVSIPSNLGKGKVWYFLCPHTKKRCRILYSITGYFLHRTAFKGCLYESQTKSKKQRSDIKLFDSYLKGDEAYQKILSKHFKTHYAGKPTRRYLKLMKLVEKGKDFTLADFERLLLG